MRYEFIRQERSNFPVSRICQVMNVSKSGYYAWIKNPQSKRAIENHKLLEEIKHFHKLSKGIYGSPRIHQDLLRNGFVCGKHRIERLMKANQIYAKTKRKFKATTYSDHSYHVAENILNRKFKVKEINKA